jgi:outer membrane protein assembly factor BamA
MKPATIKYLSIFVALVLLFFFVSLPRAFSQQKYTVQYFLSGKDTLVNFQQLQIKENFENKQSAQKYLKELPATLLIKGFAAASIDSVEYDSLNAKVKLYLGDKFKWAEISVDSIDKNVLEKTGWNSKEFNNKPMDFSRLRLQEKKMVNYYENSGYPFASVSLENVSINDGKIRGDLHVQKGPLYHIDSIHLYGNVKIKNLFLQHYLGILMGVFIITSSYKKYPVVFMIFRFCRNNKVGI